MENFIGAWIIMACFVLPLVIMIALACRLCPKADMRVGPWIIVAFIPIANIFAPWILLALTVGIALDRSEPEWDDGEWEERGGLAAALGRARCESR